jgi:hypothetical protein
MSPTVPSDCMFHRLLQVLYAIEFLIALIAVYTVWREVGGAGHLDYMQWYWKAIIGVPAAYAAVRLTVALVSTDPGRARQLVFWLGFLAALVVSAGALTYYTHLNEPQDEDQEEPGSVTPADVRRTGYRPHLTDGACGGGCVQPLRRFGSL